MNALHAFGVKRESYRINSCPNINHRSGLANGELVLPFLGAVQCLL
jgi:hypothetical protein